MALPLSDALGDLLQDTTKKPQLILEVEGWPIISSLVPQKYAQYGDDIVFGQAGLYYGGVIDDSSALPYIDLNKSTNQITQQMLVDKGGFSSVTSFDVALIDKDEYITKLITPNAITDEVLSKKARLYLSLEGAGHPKDSLLFFSGIVAGVASGAGYVTVNLASPEKLKNLEIFPKLSTEITSPVGVSDTVINVTSTENFSIPADAGTLRTYIIIGDEYIEYTGKTATSFTGCVRGQYGTIAETHSISDNVESAYRLIGNIKDLSLKLMLSGINLPYVENVEVLAINSYGPTTVQNALFVAKYNFDQYYGTVAGDVLEITDAVNPANNVTTTVNSIITTELGSYIIVNDTLVTEGTGAKIKLTSKYAVLPKFCGLEMTPDQVDVAEFEKKYNTYSANFFELDFFIKEELVGSDFINEQILYPNGCYSLPRKAKTSIGITVPPLGEVTTKKLDDTNTILASGLKIDRNISKNFYNAVVLKYDIDPVDDKYKRGRITQSANSTNRIKVANKPLLIQSDGIRSDIALDAKFEIISRRALERYQFAAESIEVQTNFATGFDIEIGDVVILDGRNLKISDTKSINGTRDFQPRLFEVQNTVKYLTGKPIRLSLVDTAYSLNGRYGVISPSSKVSTGSTTSLIKMKKSYGTTLRATSEGYKWRNFAGEKIAIRSKDFTFYEETTLVGISPTDDNALIIDPISIAPLENYVVDIPRYGTSTDPSDLSIYKNMFVYFDNQISIVSGASQTVFDISAGDLSKIKVNDLVFVHNQDFSLTSVETKVVDITGTTITVENNLGFTPALDHKIELLGFNDGGSPYRIL